MTRQVTFTAQLQNIVDMRKEQIEAIAKASIQDLINDMQTPVAKGGNMPVDTGYLRNSLVSALNGTVPAGPTRPDTVASDSFSGITVDISRLKLGDYINFAYTANYAFYQEHGSRGKRGRRFMGAAAKRWQEHVSRNAGKLQW